MFLIQKKYFDLIRKKMVISTIDNILFIISNKYNKKILFYIK